MPEAPQRDSAATVRAMLRNAARLFPGDTAAQYEVAALRLELRVMAVTVRHVDESIGRPLEWAWRRDALAEELRFLFDAAAELLRLTAAVYMAHERAPRPQGPGS